MKSNFHANGLPGLVYVLAVFASSMLESACQENQDLPFNSGSTGADGALTFAKVMDHPLGAHQMVFDEAHQQMVAFGGSWNKLLGGIVLSSETWVFDGKNWSKLSPTNSPPARSGHAMVYDPVRKQLLLFGGMTQGGRTNDTWIWNGTDWNQALPVSKPPERVWPAMTFDMSKGETVLFGGAGSEPLDDTWTWDGKNWNQKILSTKPSARSKAAMAYDPERQNSVMFGGNPPNEGRSLDDTWIWDGTEWRQRTPETHPSTRMGHQLVHDSLRKQIVLFGGLLSQGNALLYDETWFWDGVNWARQSFAASPPARHLFAMAYDPVRHLVLLHGGGDAPSQDSFDTWSLDGITWKRTSDQIQFFDMRGRGDGIWNFTTIEVHANVKVKFLKNSENTPVRWLAASNIVINGSLDLDGARGADGANPGDEAAGGPGGFSGGLGGLRFSQSGFFAGTPGQGPGGGLPGVNRGEAGGDATHAESYGNSYLQPLLGGSGGGGGGAIEAADGGGGGGGGGAILIASSRDIILNGAIHAMGGFPWNGNSRGGFGSGGAIRLQADRLSGAGKLTAVRPDGIGGFGRIRLEAYYRTYTGMSTPPALFSVPVVDKIFASSGSLLISSVAGRDVPLSPAGNTQNPDVIFSEGGPVSVVVRAQNIPDKTPVQLRITASGQIITVTNTLTGSSTTFKVTVPKGIGTIQATANFASP